MEATQLTISHWVFLAVVFAIFVSIAFRKAVIIPSIVGTFLLGLLSPLGGEVGLDRLIFAVQVVFRSLLNAGVELFDIMLVIALMVAMLRSLQAQGADRIMIAPMRKLMVGPWTAFFILAATMYTAAAFFWPTPSVALVGTVLIPVAVRVGLPAIGAAVAVNLSGHGMALSADPVIQGATRLTAGAANLDPGQVLPYTILFSFIAGAIALTLACYTLRRDMRSGKIVADPGAAAAFASNGPTGEGEMAASDRYARFFAVAVPVILLSIVALMIYLGLFDQQNAIRGGDATALLGGTAVVLLILSSFAMHGHHAMDGIADYAREGFFFAIKIFAPIIPIAGFFLLGNPDHAVTVVGDGTPGFLFDVGSYIGTNLDGNIVLLGFGIMLIGMLAGMDGSGFSGLPLVGSLAGALAVGAGVDAAALAGLGQVVTIFTGGGTVVAWAFGACADAGIAGVPPAELVRRNFLPVITALIAITIVAIFIMA
ncbi:MAG: hypothetical protein MI755_09730 [Sphingomonadales bacterium]|nr:hypothetical protein [Sphingomonadales bacterium]